MHGNLWMPPVLIDLHEFDINFQIIYSSETSRTIAITYNLRRSKWNIRSKAFGKVQVILADTVWALPVSKAKAGT